MINILKFITVLMFVLLLMLLIATPDELNGEKINLIKY